MKKIKSALLLQPDLLWALAVAVPLGLAGTRPAAAEVPPSDPEAPFAAVKVGESRVEVASQEVQEQWARRVERRWPNREGRAFRQDRPNQGASRPARPFGRRAAVRLNLTEGQREQMRRAVREMRNNQRESQRKIADARRSFRQAWRNPERTAEQIEALGEAVGRAQAEAVLQRRADRERVAGILTKDQRQRLEQMRDNRGDRFRPVPPGRRNRRWH